MILTSLCDIKPSPNRYIRALFTDQAPSLECGLWPVEYAVHWACPKLL